jgi:hypothetical protein
LNPSPKNTDRAAVSNGELAERKHRDHISSVSLYQLQKYW